MSKQGRQQNREKDQLQAGSSTNKYLLVLGVVGVLIVMFIVIMLINNSESKEVDTETTPVTGPAPASLVTALKTLPSSVFDSVGDTDESNLPKKVSGTPLVQDGKPRVVYIGAEYCPFCAAQRWAMIISLSRFGDFHQLSLTTSSSDDVFPDTPTFTFTKSTYTSPYIVFTPVEIQDRNGAPLETPSDEDLGLWRQHDPNGSIPYLNFGNQLVIVGSSPNPEVLAGKTHEEIAAALKNPKSAIAKEVVRIANGMTAAICTLTDNQPADVCTSESIASLQKSIS